MQAAVPDAVTVVLSVETGNAPRLIVIAFIARVVTYFCAVLTVVHNDVLQ